MRKLKLQSQITVDGFVGGPQGQLDWMTFDMDEKLLSFINQLTDTSDTILLGRKMTEGFIKYWEQVITQPKSPEYEFAQKMVGMPKVVFSKTVKKIEGQNVRVSWNNSVFYVPAIATDVSREPPSPAPATPAATPATPPATPGVPPTPRKQGDDL